MAIKLTTGRMITGGFVVALAVILVIGIVSFTELVRFSQNRDRISQTNKILDRLAAISNDVYEAESDQRGYLLTGDRMFLVQREAVRARTTADLAGLRELTVGNASQLRGVDRLDSLIQDRTNYLDRTIAKHDSGDLEEVRKRVGAAESKRASDAVRAQIAAMSGAEFALLQRRDLVLAESSLRVRIVITVGSLFAFLVVALSGLMIHADLYERERAHAELLEARDTAEKANRAKSDFLARMSHELRTPLNSVIGFANVLLKNKGGNLAAQDMTYLQRIHANGKHLLGVINDVLDLSKVEAGRVELHKQSVDVAELISETLAELAPRSDEKHLELITKTPPGLDSVFTDRARLKQVLINLVANAIKFTETGSVTVCVAPGMRNKTPALIEVTDTGRGIREDRREAIFGSFEQEDSGTAREFDGTGLGLAISRALCEKLGYTLELDSTPGVGSTFRIVLPSVVRQAGSAEEMAAREIALREKRRAPRKGIGSFHANALRDRTVLVIDDEPDARIILREMFEEFSARVVEVGTGEEGVRLAREVMPDAITLDLELPGMNGAQVVRKLQSDPLTKNIPLLVVSVAASASRSTLHGPAAFLDKPVVRDELIELTARHIHHGRKYVLIVESNAETREQLRAMAESEGARVRIAEGERAALRELDREIPKLLILDLVVNQAHGLQLLSAIRRDERFETMAIVVLTGPNLISSVEAGIRQKAVVVIDKDEEMAPRLQSILQIALRG